MFKVDLNFPTFALNFDLTPIEEDFLLHLVWKAPTLTGGGLINICEARLSLKRISLPSWNSEEYLSPRSLAYFDVVM